MFVIEPAGLPDELKLYLQELNDAKFSGWLPDAVSHLYRSTGYLKAYMEQTDDGVEVLLGIISPYTHDHWTSALKPWKAFLETAIQVNLERIAHLSEDMHEDDALTIKYAKAMVDHDRYLLRKINEDLEVLGMAEPSQEPLHEVPATLASLPE